MDKFVFSTRYLGDGYAFATPRAFEESSLITEYLKTLLWRSDNTYQLYETHKAEVQDFFKLKCVDFDFDRFIVEKGDYEAEFNNADDKDFRNTICDFFKKNGLVNDVKNELGSCCGKNGNEKTQSRFSHYVLQKGPQNNNTVFAIPHLNGKAESDWIALLCKEFGKGLSQDDTLYLVLHDGDVPGHNHTPLELLEDADVKALVGGGETEANVKMIVFQHSSNTIVDILIDKDITESEVVSKIKSLYENKDTIHELLNSLNDKDNVKRLMQNLHTDCSVDLGRSIIKLVNNEIVDTWDNLPSGRRYYVYIDDNGALLSELMHEKMNSSKQFKRFVDKVREPGFNGDEVVDIHKIHFPLIIKIYKSFFEDWIEVVDKDYTEEVCNHRNKKAMEENLERVFSFFNNSSIWVRVVDINDKEAYNQAVAEFEYFDNIGLYDYDSAWENLEYDTRIIKQNYLESALNGHGNYVTPELFGDEVKAIKILLGNSAPKTT